MPTRSLRRHIEAQERLDELVEARTRFLACKHDLRIRMLARPIDPLRRDDLSSGARFGHAMAAWYGAAMREGVESRTRLAAPYSRTPLTALSEDLDDITRLAARACDMPLAGVTIVAEDGTLLSAGPRVEPLADQHAVCAATIRNGDVFVVADAAADPRLADCGYVRGAPWLRFYAGAPLIMPEGDVVGVLWVADREPRDTAKFDTQPLKTLARQLVAQLSLRRANSLLAQRETELRSIIDTSGEAILGVDTRGRCTFVNPACLRILGYSEPEALLGKVVHDVIHHSHADGAPYHRGECAIFKAVSQGLPVRLDEEVLRRADGTPFWVIYTASPLYRGDELIGSVMSFVDVSEQRRIREELLAAARVRDRFTGVLGHDLRNPLSTVVMGAQLIARTATAETTRNVAFRVGQAAARMQRLIRDLLDFIRVGEGGALTLSPRPTDLAEIVREIVGELELAHPGRRIESEIVGDTLGHWDPDRLAQVCSNLLSNAIHHGSREAPVRLTLRADADDSVSIVVENGGARIPDDLRPHLFDPFRRGQKSDREDHRGLGLGLFIVREIALAHGGEVTFTSDETRTAFAVRLPRSLRSAA